MLLSVGICTWNRAASLDRTLTALATVHIPTGWDWEVLVVNNNSTDDTDQVIARHATALPIRRVFEPTPGISFARNAAVRSAQGDVLVWIDDDALPEPDWLVQLVAGLETFDADLVFGKVLPKWESGRPPRWYSVEFAGMYALLDLGGDPRVLTDSRYIGHNVNLAFRRRLLDAIGSYREDLGVGRTGGSEDVDLCRRAYAAGLRVVYQPHAVVHHVIPAQRCTKRYVRRYVWNGTRHQLLLLREEAQHVHKLFGLPRYFLRFHLGYLRDWCYSMVTGQWGRAFFYELKFLRLFALFRMMLLERQPKPHPDPLAPTAPRHTLRP